MELRYNKRKEKEEGKKETIHCLEKSVKSLQLEMLYLPYLKQASSRSAPAGPPRKGTSCAAESAATPHVLRTEAQLPPYRSNALHVGCSHCHQTWLQLKQKRALHPLVTAQNCQKSKRLGCSWRKDPQDLPLPQTALPARRAGAEGRQCLEESQSIAQFSSMETEVCDSAAQCADSCQKPNCTICQINIPIFNILLKGKH